MTVRNIDIFTNLIESIKNLTTKIQQCDESIKQLRDQCRLNTPVVNKYLMKQRSELERNRKLNENVHHVLCNIVLAIRQREYYNRDTAPYGHAPMGPTIANIKLREHNG
jgi:uncharacterized protein (DUF342 family)